MEGLDDFQILKIISKKDEGGSVFHSGKIIFRLLVPLKQECPVLTCVVRNFKVSSPSPMDVIFMGILGV